MSTAFTTSVTEGIAELVICKPPVNALDSQEWLDLAQAIDDLGADESVRVLIVRSEGRGFCAGVDIKELDAQPELIVRVNAGNYATFRAVHRCPVPVIVAVHGYVLGGGIGITGAADIVVASECASFALPEVDREPWAVAPISNGYSRFRKYVTCSLPESQSVLPMRWLTAS